MVAGHVASVRVHWVSVASVRARVLSSLSHFAVYLRKRGRDVEKQMKQAMHRRALALLEAGITLDAKRIDELVKEESREAFKARTKPRRKRKPRHY